MKFNPSSEVGRRCIASSTAATAAKAIGLFAKAASGPIFLEEEVDGADLARFLLLSVALTTGDFPGVLDKSTSLSSSDTMTTPPSALLSSSVSHSRSISKSESPRFDFNFVFDFDFDFVELFVGSGDVTFCLLFASGDRTFAALGKGDDALAFEFLFDGVALFCSVLSSSPPVDEGQKGRGSE